MDFKVFYSLGIEGTFSELALKVSVTTVFEYGAGWYLLCTQLNAYGSYFGNIVA